jgi:uroporphyrinogen decarboxylase
MAMDARENSLRIIRFDSPERVVPRAPYYELLWTGCNHEAYDGRGEEQPLGSKWADVWGTVWHKKQEGVMGLPVEHPLTRPEDLRSYEWPDPDDERICGRIYQMADTFPGGDQFLAGSHRDALWEKAYMLVGMENMMMYFLTEPEFAREVLHRIMDFHLGIAAHYADLGVELVRLSDDLGSQSGPLLGQRIVNEFLVPEYRRLCQFYKDRGTLLYFHSCGKVESVLETFMDLGVDILNPVQATANDLSKVRAVTQGRMALEGGVSSALVMEGPVERIKAEVRRRLWQLGRDGGYFCRHDQGLPFPQAHIDALEAAVEAYGTYPLQPPGEEL